MTDPERLYTTVCNDEGQYSIWPDGKVVPAGWTVIGTRDTKENCLDYIRRTWTDLRPRSLRSWMGE
ncbi:MbtH family NRPS accessory protein [Rhodococcus opacus]|nr:MbtH family NRPS accessory protein [Rhodococcus opacus]TQC43046.1 MbtH family protein [Rhodococcus sp. WS4]